MSDVTVRPYKQPAAPEPDTGDKTADEWLRESLSLFDSGNSYLLSWYGGRVPIGAIVEGREIVWTQHGVVYTAPGEEIGSYERVKDGVETPDGYYNEMIVTMWTSPAAAVEDER